MTRPAPAFPRRWQALTAALLCAPNALHAQSGLTFVEPVDQPAVHAPPPGAPPATGLTYADMPEPPPPPVLTPLALLPYSDDPTAVRLPTTDTLLPRGAVRAAPASAASVRGAQTAAVLAGTQGAACDTSAHFVWGSDDTSSLPTTWPPDQSTQLTVSALSTALTHQGYRLRSLDLTDSFQDGAALLSIHPHKAVTAITASRRGRTHLIAWYPARAAHPALVLTTCTLRYTTAAPEPPRPVLALSAWVTASANRIVYDDRTDMIIWRDRGGPTAIPPPKTRTTAEGIERECRLTLMLENNSGKRVTDYSFRIRLYNTDHRPAREADLSAAQVHPDTQARLEYTFTQTDCRRIAAVAITHVHACVVNDETRPSTACATASAGDPFSPLPVTVATPTPP